MQFNACIQCVIVKLQRYNFRVVFCGWKLILYSFGSATLYRRIVLGKRRNVKRSALRDLIESVDRYMCRCCMTSLNRKSQIIDTSFLLILETCVCHENADACLRKIGMIGLCP